MKHHRISGSFRRWAALAATVVLIIASGVASAPTARAETDIYGVPGIYHLHGRDWRTQCEPYSQTQRCRTEIRATQVRQVNGKFVQKTGWYFNNLTYLSSPRALWATNPLGGYGVYGGTAKWTGIDGRQWRTVCDTPATGRNGCRTYATASVIEAYKTAAGATAYRWVTKEIFNNIVRFGPLAVVKDVMMHTTVSLRYFDVTVSDPVSDADGTAFGARVKVCYTHAHPDAGGDGKVRVSLDPWSFGVLDLEAGASDPEYFAAKAVPSSTDWLPLYSETRLALGQCNTGYISAAHGNPDLSSQFTLRYAPAGSPDRVTWFAPS